MKERNKILRIIRPSKILYVIFSLIFVSGVLAIENDLEPGVTQFKGSIIDVDTKSQMVFATLAIEGTNIATVCNTEGEFIIKIPNDYLDKDLVISYIGYEKKVIPIKQLKAEGNVIGLKMTAVPLVEVSVFPTDPNLLIRVIMNRRDENYMDIPVKGTAFYRETIKRGWSYISLTEAVVDIFKYPYNRSRSDQVRLKIGRKSTDYGRLDTLAFKLQGGPFAALSLDIMKDPYTIFNQEDIEYYNFEMVNITRINDRLLYILNFKQKPNVDLPLFYGTLYVDTETLAITNVDFNMNIENRDEASRMFIRKKPIGANVWPTEAFYQVNYREHDGKWYFGHARAQVSFRVNWRKKLFNRNFHTTMEIAITDWEETDERSFKASDRLRMNVIMEDAVEGFADDDFWGDYNVIEPEQPIENAIKKIQKGLPR